MELKINGEVYELDGYDPDTGHWKFIRREDGHVVDERYLTLQEIKDIYE